MNNKICVDDLAVDMSKLYLNGSTGLQINNQSLNLVKHTGNLCSYIYNHIRQSGDKLVFENHRKHFIISSPVGRVAAENVIREPQNIESILQPMLARPGTLNNNIIKFGALREIGEITPEQLRPLISGAQVNIRVLESQMIFFYIYLF